MSWDHFPRPEYPGHANAVHTMFNVQALLPSPHTSREALQHPPSLSTLCPQHGEVRMDWWFPLGKTSRLQTCPPEKLLKINAFAHNLSCEVDGRWSFSFLFMGDGCRWTSRENLPGCIHFRKQSDTDGTLLWIYILVSTRFFSRLWCRAKSTNQIKWVGEMWLKTFNELNLVEFGWSQQN